MKTRKTPTGYTSYDLEKFQTAVARLIPQIEASMKRVNEKIRIALSSISDLNALLPETEARIRIRMADEMFYRRIEAERQAGLDFVKALGVQARFELGLPLCEPPKYKQP